VFFLESLPILNPSLEGAGETFLVDDFCPLLTEGDVIL